jgi:arabinogalactan endo-1,4-beta-galactosidase
LLPFPTGSIASVTIDKEYELKGEALKPRETTKMLGADISFLPQLEERGIKFLIMVLRKMRYRS